MSIEEYEKLSEERPDLLRIMDGVIYYSFDYTDYLYNELQKRDNIINEYDEKTQMLDSVCRSLEFSAPENDYIFKERLREIIDKLKELKEKK